MLEKLLTDEEIRAKIIYLRDVEGKKWEKIAEEMGIPAENCRGRYRKAKKRFISESPKPSGNVEEEQIDENHRTVEVNSERIITLEDLLKVAQVDLEVWAVDHYITNKWEVGRKATTMHMMYDDGKATGVRTDDGTISVEPLYQVKAWLIRTNPVAVKPVIHPVEVTVVSNSVSYREPQEQKIALILPDPQFGFKKDLRTNKLSPFHDRGVLSIAMQLADFLQPDVSVWLGDVNDFTMWTDKFIRNPEYYFTVQPALIEAAWVIGQIHSYSSKSVVLEGNHEQRVVNTLSNHLLDAYNLRPADLIDAEAILSVDNLLGLSRMGVEYIADWQNAAYHLNKTLQCSHGNIARGSVLATARAMLDNQAISTIFGHIHRTEMASKTLLNGETKTITAYCPGCMCKIDGSVPGSTRESQWQQGMAVVYYTDEQYTIVPLQVVNNTVLFQGKLFKGEDYLPDLKKASTWENW